MYQTASVVTRLRRGIDHILTRTGTLILLLWLTCKPAFAALPKVEAPSSGSGGGLMQDIKGYAQDGLVLAGLIAAAVAFIAVANSAIQTFVEVRNEKATWTKFGAIIVVGVVLLVAVIWLLGKSASILA